MLINILTDLKKFFVEFMQPESRLFIAFIAAQVISAYAIPIIVQIARANSLFSKPNHRTSHTNSVPTIGGLALFATILIVSLSLINVSGFSFLHGITVMPALPSIIAGITILFFIGMKDDLMGLSWKKKLTAEVAAMLVLSIIGDQRITNMQGLFGVGELTYMLSILLTVFVGIALINAFNLIDGIDGLASGIAMIASFAFGVTFYLSGFKEYAILCAIIIGTLLPFFYYNVWGTKNKLFMGDTGSLILGFLMTALVIRFNKVFFVPNGAFTSSVAAISIGILIIPIFDTLRVFTLRIRDGHSPFKADKRHIHHLMLKLGFNHLKSTLIICAVNIGFILIAFTFAGLGKTFLLILYLVLCLILVYIPILILKNRTEKPVPKTLSFNPKKETIEAEVINQ
jgi:UDP-N-acetylmuramyl pentapeptide phosphotransferase/UDP-N-acetylglucosamine-1-phosphate transferase